ncbi:MAG TPA: hypothetical protein VFZ73_19195 [Gemmatimonadaceae bacterium]
MLRCGVLRADGWVDGLPAGAGAARSSARGTHIYLAAGFQHSALFRA